MYNYFTKQFPDTERNRERILYIRKEAEKLLEGPIFSLDYSKFKLFHETGDRFQYENQYMERRRRMNLLTAMAIADEDEKWLAALEDVMWAICDESTWAFPAHIAKDADMITMLTRLDLFAAETAAGLSEICYLLKERIHAAVYNRVEYELRRRVITPHLKTVMQYCSNWSAVCAYGLCSTIVHIGTKEEFEEAKETLVQSAYDFLKSFTDDGCCLEGPLYWSYGFHNFVFLAQMLREQTNGEIDLFREEKVKNIALYLQKTALEGDYVIPFADSAHRYQFEYCLVNFLNHEYEEFVAPAPEMIALHTYGEKRERFGRFIRDFYWTEEVLLPKQTEKTEREKIVVFEESQQYIRRYDKFIFAAKGGYNAEPHNHNDIGSFIIFSEGKYLLDDLGWSEYDNKYFTAARYDNICASSLGHSVPIINGKVQLPGVDRRATAKHSLKKITLDISAVYEVDKFVREFVFGENDEIQIVDSFENDELQITERFATRIEPELCEKGVKIGTFMLLCEEDCEIRVSSQEFHPRILGDLNPTETAYFIDFVFASTKGKQTVTITLKEN